MMVFKRRQLMILSLVVMIAVAGYLNWAYRGNGNHVTTSGNRLDLSANGSKLVQESGKTTEESKTDKQTEDKKDNNTENKADKSDAAKDKSASNVDYFTTARADKEKTRNQEVQLLQSIVENESSPKESKINAQNEIIDVSKCIEKESTIENLIRAKGFKDAVAFLDKGNVNVVVRTEGLIPSQTAQIQDVVMTQTGLAPDKIKIVESK